MGKYKCDKCPYETNSKRNFEKHQNRKLPCWVNHTLVMKGKEKTQSKNETPAYCNICKHEFSTNSSLNRHNKNFHPNNTIQLTNGSVIGNKNKIKTINSTTNNITNNTNNITNINNKIIIQPIIINKYDHDNINDLTLYEQYFCITSKDSPYIALIDHLNLNPKKPIYNNVVYKNIHKSTINVHNGYKWLIDLVSVVVPNIISSKQKLIRNIINRFRIFLTNEAISYAGIPYYDGFKHKHKSNIVGAIKCHLYNEYLSDDIKQLSGPIPPCDPNDPVWWALDPKFNWKKVEKFLMICLDNNIDFNQNLDEIKECINNLSKKNSTLHNFFKPYIRRINSMIKKNKQDDSNSDFSDISFDESSSCDKNSDHIVFNFDENDFIESDSIKYYSDGE